MTSLFWLETVAGYTSSHLFPFDASAGCSPQSPPSSSYRPLREMSAFTLHSSGARRVVNELPAPTARVARFPAVTSRLLRPAQFPRADKPREETAMTEPDTTTEATHTPGPWRVFDLFTDLEIVTDRKTAHETESIVQFKGQPNAKSNARR